MTVIDGKRTAAAVRAELKERVRAFEEKCGTKIGLAVILVGQDPASQVYVRNKIKACEEVGIRSFAHYLPETVSQGGVLKLVSALAGDASVHGILVQLPLPGHLNEEELLAAIPPEKDVDGFCAENLGLLAQNRAGTVACTPLGVMELLKRYRVSVSGKRAVVLGRSNIVGRPMALLLLNADATVTICHSKTGNLKEECSRADILVAAIGKPRFVTADMVKDGAVVIDVGINRDADGSLCGDVDFDAVKDKVSYITPVPGGVGPMTIAMLLENTVNAAERSEK
ncbi:MAG: bifunctional methylenetetrahydrofolate dehydrogenase/methenyltetrahydrofolate cyclohydrolase FolD [Clostridia bacterium]|nr:bifunctional methylenetetrahydrofolate dehydrogenase/methenyltetrahydrofolate cyclohydrolase FolD [Clostridia bacterium]